LLNKFDHDRDGTFSAAERSEAQAYLDAQKRLKEARNRQDQLDFEARRAAESEAQGVRESPGSGN
jgi:hypothetical protein